MTLGGGRRGRGRGKNDYEKQEQEKEENHKPIIIFQKSIKTKKVNTYPCRLPEAPLGVGSVVPSTKL